MTAYVVAIHKKPADPDAYHQYYMNVHVPLALKVPGLVKYEVSKGAISDGNSETDIYLVATLHFPDLETAHAAFESPEGAAAVADLPNFAEPGNIELLLFESYEIPVEPK